MITSGAIASGGRDLLKYMIQKADFNTAQRRSAAEGANQ